ncbi:hypothetical protein PsorP6_006771 [Peronosclerospora sorghi]|uniref:Uncharacterized protein n=1 Tax=Peronosclerospora sorghi TaxID=230839 RepID=A0ACC0W4F5_9STRA|nr:hypothetical protein PsorP6_006771 [Peronosclerospora sorghi]
MRMAVPFNEGGMAPDDMSRANWHYVAACFTDDMTTEDFIFLNHHSYTIERRQHLEGVITEEGLSGMYADENEVAWYNNMNMLRTIHFVLDKCIVSDVLKYYIDPPKKHFMAAEQAKERGNRAFSAGLYADAVACFSEALAVATSDANAHVYYSNRSAAQLKLNKAEEALQDAEQCIALKPSWPKGYSRRGSALFSLGRYPEARQAYKDGLNFDKANEGLLEGLRAVEAKLLTQRVDSSSAPVNSMRSFLFGNKRNMFQVYQFVLRSLMLFCFVNYWTPVLLSSYAAYSNFFKLAMVNYVSYLAFTHGLPKWSTAYAQRLLDPATQMFFFCLIFWVSVPYGFALMPVFLLEMVHFFSYLQSLLQVVGLANLTFVKFVTSKALVPITALIIGDPTFPAQATHAKWATLYNRIPQVAANIDVAIGIALILEMLLPSRNFLLLVLFWQVLRVRYMISPQLREAFRLLHASISTVVNHPRCPAIFRFVYTKIYAFVVKMGDATQQQQASPGAGGLASRCTIM